MPVRDSRVFGAGRPGHRPAECRNGHCGVDIGGERWGEPIMAVHDGVVDYVQRGPNEERGGLYVRLAHRNGTVFTQYFHLAAIPRWITPGRPVEAGDMIGLLGDSGVKNSGPHLHFTISVKPGEHIPEQYIDPEPLIALWPVKIPAVCGAEGSKVTADVAPGRVLGAAGRRTRSRRHARDDVDAVDVGEGEGGVGSEATESTATAAAAIASPPGHAAAPVENASPGMSGTP
jgi:hypothetical protein